MSLLQTDLRHFAPHSSAFEGWYSRFHIPSTGASILFVICSVPAAPTRPHMLSLTYINPEGKPVYQKQLWPSRLDRRRVGDGWMAVGSSEDPRFHGTMRASSDGMTSYDVACDDYSLHATTSTRLPFRAGHPESTPEGWMVNLPLPLHWHVHSLASQGSVALDVPAADIHVPHGTPAVVHQEKNWADSFPGAHMWLQARTPAGAHLCLAGGRVYPFLTAYILTFRGGGGAAPDIWLRPPLTLGLFGVSPFLAVDIDWPARRFALSARCGWATRLEVVAQAGRDSFYNLGAPFAEGHRLKALGQTLDAVVEVGVWRREGWLGWLGLGPWRLASTEVFRGAGLEFGGEYYGDAEL